MAEETKSRSFNFGLMALYQVIVRTGWIFKTESIIMPIVLDIIGGSAWLRGFLPMLSRLGQSIPPMITSDVIRRTAKKKFVLSGAIGTMGLCFVCLSLIWQFCDVKCGGWMPFVFLSIYAIFFISVGIHQLAMSLLVGKLIPVTRRGRLMFVAMTVGCTSAVLCAWFLLRKWLAGGNDNFVYVFAFTGLSFVTAAGLCLLLKEAPDPSTGNSKSLSNILRSSMAVFALDKNFRLLAIVGGLFGMCLTLFPHYQKSDLAISRLIWIRSYLGWSRKTLERQDSVFHSVGLPIDLGTGWYYVP